MSYKIPGSRQALSMATLAFAANFSVWTLYAAMALHIAPELNLSSTDLGLLFAAPMLTGALIRIPAGFIIEFYQPKTVFIWQMLLVSPSLFLLPSADSFTTYILVGLWLGISGASFTIGMRYINDWFESNQQGTAMGIFGLGNAGAAITLAGVPIIVEYFDWSTVGYFYGVGILTMAFLFYLLAPLTPQHLLPKQPENIREQIRVLKSSRIWRYGLYYYFVFGSFLALIMWLPQYYLNAYEVSISTAMAFTLFFVVTSSMMRVLGGRFADRFGGRAVNWSVFWVCIVCLFFLSYPPTTMTIHGFKTDVDLNIEINIWVFTALIFIIGIAQGFGRTSVYKVLQDHYPQQMGSIGGVVGAIGAAGGFSLPIIFGLATDMVGIYSVCFMLLYGLSAVCMILMYFSQKADRYKQRVKDAHAYNFLDYD